MNYVLAGYILVTVTLTLYAVRLTVLIRRLKTRTDSGSE